MSDHTRRHTLIPLLPVRATPAPTEDVDPTEVDRGRIKSKAGGLTAIAVTAQRGISQMGTRRSFATLRHLNQAHGFDCMGCAWPDPDPEHRSFAEFCENGAKAVAEEGDHAPGRPRLLRAAHPVAELGDLERLPARPAGPDHRADGAARGRHPLRADLVGRRHRPRRRARCAASTSRARPRSTRAGGPRTRRRSRYQLFARAFGTNNLPDCSNMCHESTSVALAESIGIGKGSVSLRRHPRGRAHRHRRAEPRHQPPAHAERPREGQGAAAPGSSRSTRCPRPG